MCATQSAVRPYDSNLERTHGTALMTDPIVLRSDAETRPAAAHTLDSDLLPDPGS